MDSPDTRLPAPEDSSVKEPDESLSLFDVMAATQRFLAQNMVDITTMAAQQEVDLKNAREAANQAIVEKDAAILTAQEAEFKAEYLRTHDSLTGLPNKVYLTESLEKQIADNRTIGVFSIDVVGFKTEINDKLGHPNGDRFLKSWSNYASVAFSRVSDIVAYGPDEPDFEESVARTGGDEFYLMSNLGTASIDETQQRAGTTEVQAQNEHDFIHHVFAEFMASSEWAGSRLTVSVGYAVYEPGDSTTAEELIEISDARMYEEKEAQHLVLGLKR